MTELKNSELKVIYILGQPHSGSTIFSTWMSSFFTVHYLGELYFFNKDFNDDRPCSCERKLCECPIWKPIFKEVPKIAKANILNNRVQFMLNVQLNCHEKLQLEIKNQYSKILNVLSSSQEHPGIFIDSSKSIDFLKVILQTGVQIELVYLRRNLRDVFRSLIIRPKKYSKFGRLKLLVVTLGLILRDIRFHYFFKKWKGLKSEVDFDDLIALTNDQKIQYLQDKIHTLKSVPRGIGISHLFSGNRKVITNRSFENNNETAWQKIIGDIFFK